MEEDEMPPVKIQGCPVYFPYKAYPSQLSMMNRIMQSLVTKQNSLLESPTGSGKSLSLLCSALGWLTQHIEERVKKIDELRAKCVDVEGTSSMNTNCCPLCSNSMSASTSEPRPEAVTVPSFPKSEDAFSPPPKKPRTDEDFKTTRFHDEELDEDFKETRFCSSFVEKKAEREEAVKQEAEDSDCCASSAGKDPSVSCKLEEPSSCEASMSEDRLNGNEGAKTEPYFGCIGCSCHLSESRNELDNLLREKVPKVFYGTRTHNQIAQIIREMKKTKYKHMNTSVLSSRSHSCVNSYVQGHQRMNEACRELISDSGCAFYSKVHNVNSHYKLKEDAYLEGAFDVEELVTAVKHVGACPYYAARELIDSAHIIFCPYNYLLDPSFRDAVGINLSGHIVIFDEAHNIENTACDSVSFVISKEQLESAREDLTGLVLRKVKEKDHAPLLTMVNNMLTVMDLTRPRLIRQDSGDASMVWTGQEIIAFLERVGIGPNQLSEMRKHFAAVSGEKDRDMKEEFVPKRQKKKEKKEMESATSSLLGNLFLCLGIMFKDEMRFSGDYRVALLENTSYERAEPSGTPSRWLSKRQGQSGVMKEKQELTLNFWCLNPAVAFDDIASQTRSIILTSGTLSPLSSFASELALEFPLRLEANHVVKPDQTFVASVGSAPNGGTLCATFQYYETFRFQDDLGSLVLALCQRVPHGVLCFVSSYSLADKLIRRWDATGLLSELRAVKHVAVEPRKVADMTGVLDDYYEAVADSANGPDVTGRTGAFMMAVCRGKMSEGQDFADQNARLVITVGIPYPNVKITKICLKRGYNDKNQSDRNLLSGSEWYEVQAFRALNQALGRCIRHRHDWGAVIMVDVRLCERADRYLPNISKWLRQRVQRFPNCRSLLSRLEDFVARRKAAEERGEVEIHFRRGRMEEEDVEEM